MSANVQLDKFKFQSPTNIIIAGSTQSGKTFFTVKLIENAKNLFSNVPVKIFYCYNIFQNKFNDLEGLVDFHQGIPDIEKIADKKNRHFLLIFDDLMQSIDKQMVNLFTVQTHHLNFSCVFILQNMFFQNKYF